MNPVVDDVARIERAHGWSLASRRVPSPVSGGAPLWVCETEEVHYPEAGYAALAAADEHSFWFDHRHAVVSSMVADAPGAMWDIGAGSGGMATRFLKAGRAVVALEPGATGALTCVQRGVPTILGTLSHVGLPDGALDLAGAFDVLEHLDEPEELLAELHRVLRPGGRVVVTVPALPALWSDDDVAAEHRRRYRRRDLVALGSGAGFEVRRCTAMFAHLVPPAALLRALPYRLHRRRSADVVVAAASEGLAPSSALVDRALRGVGALERKVLGRVDVPVGLSLVAVFVRR